MNNAERKQHLKTLNIGGLTIIEVHNAIISSQNSLFSLERIYDMLAKEHEYYADKLPYYNTYRISARKLKIQLKLADIDMLLKEVRNYIEFLLPPEQKVGE